MSLWYAVASISPPVQVKVVIIKFMEVEDNFHSRATATSICHNNIPFVPSMNTAV